MVIIETNILWNGSKHENKIRAVKNEIESATLFKNLYTSFH